MISTRTPSKLLFESMASRGETHRPELAAQVLENGSVVMQLKDTAAGARLLLGVPIIMKNGRIAGVVELVHNPQFPLRAGTEHLRFNPITGGGDGWLHIRSEIEQSNWVRVVMLNALRTQPSMRGRTRRFDEAEATTGSSRLSPELHQCEV